MKLLSTALIGLLAAQMSACAPALSPQPDPHQVQAAQTTALSFVKGTGWPIQRVLSEVEDGYFRATGEVVRVVFEPAASGSVFSGYNLADQYADLHAVAADIETQNSVYKWTVTTTGSGTYLIGKPQSGAFLDKAVSAFTTSDQTACETMKQLNLAAEPATVHSAGCMVRRPPRFITESHARDLKDQKASLTVSGSVESATIALLDALDADISLTIIRANPAASPIWEITW